VVPSTSTPSQQLPPRSPPSARSPTTPDGASEALLNATAGGASQAATQRLSPPLLMAIILPLGVVVFGSAIALALVRHLRKSHSQLSRRARARTALRAFGAGAPHNKGDGHERVVGAAESVVAPSMISMVHISGWEDEDEDEVEADALAGAQATAQLSSRSTSEQGGVPGGRIARARALAEEYESVLGGATTTAAGSNLEMPSEEGSWPSAQAAWLAQRESESFEEHLHAIATVETSGPHEGSPRPASIQRARSGGAPMRASHAAECAPFSSWIDTTTASPLAAALQLPIDDGARDRVYGFNYM